jgi:signal transduction histidine kinase
MVTYLRKGSTRILEITENLLGTGKGMERQPIELSPFLRDVVSQSMPTALARGARIESAVANSLVVVAPATPLRMTVVNILQNAIEAVPQSTGRVHISTRHDNGRLGLAISDNGPGIPRALRRKIFDPLVTTKADGSGLGLPVARQLIEDMKGSLELESVPGTGTTFIVWLPTAT